MTLFLLVLHKNVNFNSIFVTFKALSEQNQTIIIFFKYIKLFKSLQKEHKHNSVIKVFCLKLKIETEHKLSMFAL